MGSLKAVGSSLFLSRSVVRFRSFSRCINTNSNTNANGDFDANRPSRTLFGSSKLYDIINQFWLFRSISFISYTPLLKLEPTRSYESSECLCFYINMDGVAHDMVRVSVSDNDLTIRGVYGSRIYYCPLQISTRNNFHLYKVIDIKAEMNHQGELKLTIPKFKPQELMSNIKKPLKPDELMFRVKVNAID